MKLPLQVTFRNMQASAAVEAEVRERAQKLERFYSEIMSCRVAIEPQQRQHHKGNLYHVRIDVKVPDSELVTSREPPAHHAHEDVYVAVRDAFDAMRRQIEDYARTRRGEVKTHAA
jgi:ribosomal subunit interface protein